MASFDPAAVKRALELARRAPSAHNLQPWRVDASAERIVIRNDPGRSLPHTDPTSRDLLLSLGAFVEALVIGLAAEKISVARVESAAGAYATLIPAGECAPDLAAASLLRRRQSSRLAYSTRALEPELLEQLGKEGEQRGLRLTLAMRGAPEREKLEGWLLAASRESWLDARAVAELRPWLRFDPEGARPCEEGMSTHCLNLGTAEAVALKVLVRPGLWKAADKIFAAPVIAGSLAKGELESVKAAPVLAILVSDGVALDAGGALLRIWMEATRLGLAVHPISVLLDRRGWEVAKLLGVETSRLVAAWRVGRSAPPPTSGRLPVERWAQLS